MQLDCKRRGGWLRRAALALALAATVVVAQQEAARHDFGHAVEQLGERQPGTPHEPAQCALHGLFAGFSAAAVPHVALPAVPAAVCETGEVRLAFHRCAARLAFRSRAPPFASA